MARKRSKPMLVAPLIPAWAAVGIYAIDELHHTRWLAIFVVIWSVFGAALFVYILRQALEQKRARSRRNTEAR